MNRSKRGHQQPQGFRFHRIRLQSFNQRALFVEFGFVEREERCHTLLLELIRRNEIYSSGRGERVETYLGGLSDVVNRVR